MEDLREELHELTEKFKLTDPNVVKVSQDLDIKIVEYMKAQINIKA